MQYFAAFAWILLWSVNGLQCQSTYNNIASGSSFSQDIIWTSGPPAKLEVWPQIVSGLGQKLILSKRNHPLNMTCTAVHQNYRRSNVLLSDYIVDWKIPSHLSVRDSGIERGQAPNVAWLWFEKLAEKDAGDYKCMAVSNNSLRQPPLSVSIHLSVKHKIKYCGSGWFRCHSSNCISPRYLCDGMRDCDDGEDEASEAGCGPDPCAGKIMCDQRCMPPEWCCDQRNCSGNIHSPYPVSVDHSRFTDMSFLQMTIYTVIGCAMAFMFIVTILVIAICRVQIKRAMASRCTQQIRLACTRRRNTVPLYDLDLYLNRSADLGNSRGVSVMYNINSGVQIMGRPVEPPPYSEVISAPPWEGPPPPYVSCENLLDPPIVQMILPVASSVAPSDAQELIIDQNATIGSGDDSIVSAAFVSQNSSNLTDTQSFTAGQTPVPQIRPTHGVSSNASSSGASNVVLDVPDGISLNAPDNLVVGIDSFAIGRSAASNSQNFEPECVETDSLLIDSRCNDGHQKTDRVSDDRGRPRVILEHQKTLPKQFDDASTHWHWFEINRTSLESNGRNRDFSRGNSENEGTFLEAEQDFDSTDSASNQNTETTVSLPFSVNINDSLTNGKTKSYSLNEIHSAASGDDNVDSNLVTNDRKSVNRDLKSKFLRRVDDSSAKRATAGATSEAQFHEYNDESASGNCARNVLSLRKNLDRVACSENPGYFPIKDNAEDVSSLVTEVSRKCSNDASANPSGNDISASSAFANNANREKNVSQRETQALVLPLRESFIGVQKEK